MKLWSVQSSTFVDIAMSEGVAYPAWDHVDELWQPAFRWMVGQLAARGLGTANGTPPVWAWHSCGGWNCPPEREDLDMLLGGEPQPHLNLVMVSLEVADADCLLSYYGPWCDVIYHSVTHDGEIPEALGLWHEPGPVPQPWREQGNEHDIQACLSRLDRRHILRVDALDHWSASIRGRDGEASSSVVLGYKTNTDEELARTFLQPGSEAWGVYADELQARGDPRGELITLELSLDGDLPAEQRERIEAAAAPLREQFAAALARRLERAKIQTGVTATWRFGFLSSVKVERSLSPGERLACVVAGDEARFLSTLEIEVFANQLGIVAEQLSAKPRVLRSLSISSFYDRKPSAPLSASEGIRLSQALPCLRSFTLIGRRMLVCLEHPSLESLCIRGHDAIVELDRVDLPNLVELEYSLMCGSLLERVERVTSSAPDLDQIAAALDGPALPALRRLDLSRNNPGILEDSVYLGGEQPGVLFEVLALTSVSSRLEELILPTASEAQILDALDELVRVPKLRMPILFAWTSRVSVARLCELLPNLEIGAEYPHRPVPEIHGRELMSIQTNPCSTSNSVWVGLQGLAGMLADRLHTLSPTSRASLDDLIDGFEDLEYSDSGLNPREQIVSMTALRCAINELVHEAESADHRVLEFVDLLEQHIDCCETMTIKRVWD